MWATWANLGPRQGQNCVQIGPTSANNNNTNNNHNNNNHHNLGPRQGQTCAQIRAPAPHPCPCRRPSVVTEGYIRLPPCRRPTSYLPRTYLCPIPVHPRSTIIVVIYSVFCVRRSKNIVFNRVLWPSPSPDFILATLKNHGFFMVLGLRKGSGTENWTSCRPWCQHRANIGQDVGYMGQHKAKIGASLRQHRANIGQDVGYMGRHKG